ncbi:MAG: hypothetical protein PSX37_10990 [bacterium]|nr:hypothetical protein [bacterium]
MEKLKGTLNRSDVEGGVWVFTADSGRQYTLDGLPKDCEKDGARLEIEGKEAQTLGFAMMGTVFQVRSAKAVG